MSTMNFLKSLRQVGILALVILILLVLAGVLYVLFSNQQGVHTDVVSAGAVNQASPITPKAPAANAKEGVAIQALTPSAAPGSVVSVVATTNATSRCTIHVDASVDSQDDPALAPQVADAYGTVSWSWRVSRAAGAGNKSLEVTCAYHGRTGVVDGQYTVSR
jgi:hypothetical protein